MTREILAAKLRTLAQEASGAGLAREAAHIAGAAQRIERLALFPLRWLTLKRVLSPAAILLLGAALVWSSSRLTDPAPAILVTLVLLAVAGLLVFLSRRRPRARRGPSGFARHSEPRT
jgi:hypothetical protein